MTAEELRGALCRHFCHEASVVEVPAGLAFSLPFEDAIGDRIGAYLIRDRGAPYLADDGTFVAEMEARGLDPLKGQRREFLDRVLRAAGAYIDEETFEIRTHPMSAEPEGDQMARFIGALAAARSVQFWTREAVRSTFAEDATRALQDALGGSARIEAGGSPVPELADFAADLVIRPKGQHRAVAVFLVQDVAKLTEALLVWQTIQSEAAGAVPVAAVIEDGATVPTTSKKVMRAVNRLDETVYFRGDERTAMRRVAQLTGIPVAPTLN